MGLDQRPVGGVGVGEAASVCELAMARPQVASRAGGRARPKRLRVGRPPPRRKVLVGPHEVGRAGRRVEAAGEMPVAVVEVLADRRGACSPGSGGASARRSRRAAGSPRRRARRGARLAARRGRRSGASGSGRAEPRRAAPSRRGRASTAACRRSVAVESRPELTMRLRELRLARASASAASRKRSSWARARRDEVGRAGRVADVLVGGRRALDVVGLEQARAAPRRRARRRASRRGSRRPGCPSWRRARRRARPGGRRRRRRPRARARSARAAGTGRCRPRPIRARSRSWPSIASRRGITRSGCCSSTGVGVPAELQVDAPDVVGLLVQQRRLAGVERRVEPEPALGGKSAVILTSAIRNRSSNASPSKVEAEHAPQRSSARRRRRSPSRRRARTGRRGSRRSSARRRCASRAPITRLRQRISRSASSAARSTRNCSR